VGLGFAIPVSTAKQVLEGIVKEGVVTRGWIGVEPAELSPELMETFGVKAKKGVLITGVLQNGPAAQAGVRPGDVIVEVAGKPISTMPELLTTVAGLKPGEATKFRIQRKGDDVEVDVTPGKRPKPRQAPQQQR
jgi:serine protease DegQ